MPQAGWRTLLPFRWPGTLGAGTVQPVSPLSTTTGGPKSVVSGVDIRRQITQIRNNGDQNLALALTVLQDYTNTNDQRVRDVSGSLNSVGLTKDPAGNVIIQGATFSVSLPLQKLQMFNGSVIQGAPPAAPSDTQIPTSALTMWINEGSNTLTIRIRKSDGTYFTKTL